MTDLVEDMTDLVEDMTDLVEDVVVTCPVDSVSTSPLRRRTTCMESWEVRIWALALACMAVRSSACSMTATAPDKNTEPVSHCLCSGWPKPAATSKDSSIQAKDYKKTQLICSRSL
jgi:hypothetical protein